MIQLRKTTIKSENEIKLTDKIRIQENKKNPIEKKIKKYLMLMKTPINPE